MTHSDTFSLGMYRDVPSIYHGTFLIAVTRKWSKSKVEVYLNGGRYITFSVMGMQWKREQEIC